MAIIEQNGIPNALPDFRNLGVLLRTLLTVNLATMLAALLDSVSFGEFAARFSLFAALVEPCLLAVLMLLYGLTPRLRALPYRRGVLAVLSLSLFSFVAVYSLLAPVLELHRGEGLLRGLIYTSVLGGLLLQYFQLRNKALSPALAEARLQALQARIRPHFLFNSINAVLSLIRSEPRKAERALEDLAELFRVLMAENKQMSTLWRELELARNYLALEELRLGERLKIVWHTDKAPMQAAIPPLILQPLLENAVYHGIAPSVEGGQIDIDLHEEKQQWRLEIRNTKVASGTTGGNRIAQANIAARLEALGQGARLQIDESAAQYRVQLWLPKD